MQPNHAGALVIALGVIGSACGAPPSGAEPDAMGSGSEDAGPYDPAGVVGYSISLGATRTIFPDPEPVQDPLYGGQTGRGLGLDVVSPDGRLVRKVFAMFGEHDDIPSAPQTNGVVTSVDGGETFGGHHAGIQAPPAFALELRDGRVLSYGFVPTARTDTAGATHLTLAVDASVDHGETWQSSNATVTVPTMTGGLGRVSGHPIELADGTILLPFYTDYTTEPGGYCAELLASSDGGHTFVRRASIGRPGVAGTQYPEPDIVQLQDGSLYSVFRHQVGANLSPLLFARSNDLGMTWSTPAPVLIAFDGAPPAPRVGINPQLMLMPNGVLVLSSGRNDNFVAVSTDPTHVAWTAQVTYVNYPAASTAFGPDIRRVHGSSGNTGIVAVDANRLVHFGDNCANGWGCPASDSHYTVDGRKRVWRRLVEVNTPDVGKIDLLSKFQHGLVHVDTDMTWTSTTHPRARVDGAFDGSTEYWSSAVKRDGGGTFSVALDHRYQLTRVGLSIHRGVRGSASVFTSLDGVQWSAAPIVSALDRAHQALEYFVLSRPVAASFVKVVVDAAGGCDAELGSSCAFLNELELYSTVDSFENDPIGAAPRGYTDVTSAWVTDYQVGETRRALRLVDSSATAIARVTWVGTPALQKRLEFAVEPITLPGGFLFDIGGEDANGRKISTYHLSVIPDGSLAQFSATTNVWTKLTAAGVVPFGTFTRLRVDATLDLATIAVFDVDVATTAPSTVGAVALDAHGFASSGTAPVGDQVLIDDVYFQ